MQAIYVKDLMVPLEDYAHVVEDTSLRDAVVVLQNAQQEARKADPNRPTDRGVLVLNSEHEVIGKLSMLDVLKGLEPRYDRIVGSKAISRAASRVGFAQEFIDSMVESYGLWNKPLQNLAEKACQIKVKHLIRPPTVGEYVDKNASLDIAIHELIMGQHLSLFVTGGEGRIVGILRLSDVFQKVGSMIKACSR